MPHKRKKSRKGPKIGQIVTVRGTKARIFKVHPFGTIDVLTLDGKNAYRISGLA